jgi:SET domain-containing protein
MTHRILKTPDLHNHDDLIELKESFIHHRGVFARCEIHQETRIIQYLGEKITAEESDRREQIYGDEGVTYLFDLENRYVIDGAVNGNLAVYINHSCDPNCRIEIEGDGIWIFASRPISAGEILTYDYWFEPADDEATAIPCHCRAVACRRTLNRPPDPNAHSPVS